jgi:hypothetical protein
MYDTWFILFAPMSSIVFFLGAFSIYDVACADRPRTIPARNRDASRWRRYPRSDTSVVDY